MIDKSVLDQRAHELASQAALNNYSARNEFITDSNAFEFGILYRNIYREIRKSLEEGQSDLQ